MLQKIFQLAAWFKLRSLTLEKFMLAAKNWESLESRAGAKFKSGGDVAEIFPIAENHQKLVNNQVGKRAIELESLVYWNHNALN